MVLLQLPAVLQAVQAQAVRVHLPPVQVPVAPAAIVCVTGTAPTILYVTTKPAVGVGKIIRVA